MTRPVDFKSANWLKVSASVRKRDNGTCYVCKTTQALSTHHITPKRQGGKSIPRNLVTLCQSCHDRAEEAENTWIWIQTHKKWQKKTSIKFNINNPPEIPIKPGQHLAFNKSTAKWHVWGRDKIGIYSIEVDPSMDKRSLDCPLD